MITDQYDLTEISSNPGFNIVRSILNSMPVHLNALHYAKVNELSEKVKALLESICSKCNIEREIVLNEACILIEYSSFFCNYS